MKITIFGAGYVGLVTGTCLSELGNEVLICDIDERKIEKLSKGTTPFYEPGLNELIERNIKESRLIFTNDPKEAVNFGKIIFIAVGTPPKENGEADLSFVFNVAKNIGQNLKEKGVVVITKSTVPVGTTKEVSEIIKNEIKSRNSNLNFYIANNPEFLREGKAVEDFMIPDRLVIGVEDTTAKNILEQLYSPLTKNGHLIFFMDILSSEMTKYASNTFIAARISLINELAQICEKTGADIEMVRAAVGSDKRIGNRYIYPGIGYGGSCFPKDIQALSTIAKKFGVPTPMTDAIEQVNENQKSLFAKKIISSIPKAKKIAVWGLAFKPDTDDMRAAPSIEVINALLEQNLDIHAFDPVAHETAKNIFGEKITYGQDMYSILENADALILITEWSQFKEPDFNKIKNLLKTPLIFDGRNIYSPSHMSKHGFTYHSVGRSSVA